MERLTKHLLATCFLALLWAPMWQMATKQIEELPLVGVENSSEQPQFSVQALFAGKYQSAIEDWFSVNIGFRNSLVRTDNQLNFSMFRMMSTGYASPLVVGKDNTLFQKVYIESYNNQNAMPDRKLARLTKKLRALQDKLKERGVEFLVLITPSKAEIYPDKIPERFIDERRRNRIKGNYYRFLPMLEAAGVNVLDAHKLMKDLRASSPYPVFPKGGTHWSEYASCQAAGRLAEEFGRLLKRPTRGITCEPVEVSERPNPFDADIANLANLWCTKAVSSPLPYPRSKAVVPEGAYRPKVLFIGTSFMWTVYHFLDKHRIYSTRDFYYYYSRNFRYRNNTAVPNVTQINKAELDWNKSVFSKDVIVLEINEAKIDESGHGFIGDALKKLKAAAPLTRQAELSDEEPELGSS